MPFLDSVIVLSVPPCVLAAALGMSWPDIMRKHMLTSFADAYEVCLFVK